MNWVILSGSYPPDRGGVADYSEQLARLLARRGELVWVFTGPGPVPTDDAAGITLRRLPNQFGIRALARLNGELRRIPHPRRLFVQYIPQALGPNLGFRQGRFRGLPLAFCLWLRLFKVPVWTMFHELRYDAEPGAPLPLRLLSAVTHWMVRLAMRSSSRVFLSIPAWDRQIREDIEPRCELEWLPIPSNVPRQPDPAAVAEARKRALGDNHSLLIGHFGTFKAAMTDLFEWSLPRLLTRGRKLLLIGQGSAEYGESLLARLPGLRGRVVAAGELSLDAAAAHIAACDLMLQPFPDGASSRRSSLMAPLALGRPIVTNEGPLSEALWRESGSVILASFGDREATLRTIEELIASAEWRTQLSRRATRFYQAHFDWERTMSRILSEDAVRPGGDRAPGLVEAT